MVIDVAQPENDVVASEPRASGLQDRMHWGPTERAGSGDEAVNVLVFTHDLGYGGAQLYLVELLERLMGLQRLTATVVAPSDGPLRERMESLGIQVHVTAGYPVSTVDLYEGKIAELLAWAGPQNFDIALVNTMMAFTGIDVADRLGIPSIFSIHESYELDDFWVTVPDGVDPYVRERGPWTPVARERPRVRGGGDASTVRRSWRDTTLPDVALRHRDRGDRSLQSRFRPRGGTWGHRSDRRDRRDPVSGHRRAQKGSSRAHESVFPRGGLTS